MADLSSFDQRNLFGADLVLAGLLEPDDVCFTIKKEISSLFKDSDFDECIRRPIRLRHNCCQRTVRCEGEGLIQWRLQWTRVETARQECPLVRQPDRQGK